LLIKKILLKSFFEQATTIFEAALNIKATIVEEALREHYAAELAEAKAQYEQDLEAKLDEYLEYVADTWMEENEIAIESALKVEMAETFMDGIRTLFTESNVTIPEEKVDQFDEMEKKVEELTTSLDEAVNDTIALTGVIKDQNGQILFNEKSQELTLKQRDEFIDLVEGLDFEDMDDYNGKLDTILDTYFNKKPATTDIVESIAVDIESEDKPKGISDGPMAAYAQAISRTLQN